MCFTLSWIEQMLIFLIIICAVVALIKLLVVPYVIAPMGQPGMVLMQVANIVIWAMCAIFVIYIIFDLLSCAFGGFGTARLH